MIMTITPEAALFSDPESEDAKLQELILNMLGGLKWKDLTEEEKELLRKNGFDEEIP